MSYYYTIKEYATIKGIDLSAQEETEASEWATKRSNERGIPINKVPGKDWDKKANCFSTRILQETFSSEHSSK